MEDVLIILQELFLLVSIAALDPDKIVRVERRLN